MKDNKIAPNGHDHILFETYSDHPSGSLSYLRVNELSCGPRIFAHHYVWSEDSRYLAITEILEGKITADATRTSLCVFDLMLRQFCEASQAEGGLITPLRFEGQKLIYQKEFKPNFGPGKTGEYETEIPKLSRWRKFEPEAFSPRNHAVLEAVLWESQTIFGAKYPGAYLLIDEVIAGLGHKKHSFYSEWSQKGSKFREMKNYSGGVVSQKALAELTESFKGANGPTGEFDFEWKDFRLSARAAKIIAGLALENFFGLEEGGFSLYQYVERELLEGCRKRVAKYEDYLKADSFPIQIDQGVFLSRAQAKIAREKFAMAGDIAVGKLKVIADLENWLLLLEDELGHLFLTATYGGVAMSAISIRLNGQESRTVRASPAKILELGNQVVGNLAAYEARAVVPALLG